MATATSPTRFVAHEATAGAAAWRRPAYIVSGLLAAAAGASAAGSLFLPGVLVGPAVMNGSARGTALVMLILGLPVLMLAMYFAARGSLRAHVVWLGATAYLAYNGVMFVLGTPLNELYLLYEALVAFAVWTALLVLRDIDMDRLGRAFSVSFPRRGLAVVLIAVATLNAVAWLAAAVPATLSGAPERLLAGLGVMTVPTYDQDLAFWIPLMFVAATWMWRRVEWGRLISGALFAMGVIEGVGVAVDQWMGSAADPSSTVASAAMTPVFLVLAAVELVALLIFLRPLRGRTSP